MKCDLKIMTTKDPVTGEVCVPPDALAALLEFGRHCDICDECGKAKRENRSDGYCRTGIDLHQAILDCPSVSVENVRE